MSFDPISIVVDHVAPNGPTTSHLSARSPIRHVRNALTMDGKRGRSFIAPAPSPQEETINQLRDSLCSLVAGGKFPVQGDSFQIGGWQAVFVGADVTYNLAHQRRVRATFSVVPEIDGWDSRELSEIFYEDAVEKLRRVEAGREGPLVPDVGDDQ